MGKITENKKLNIDRIILYQRERDRENADVYCMTQGWILKEPTVMPSKNKRSSSLGLFESECTLMIKGAGIS